MMPTRGPLPTKRAWVCALIVTLPMAVRAVPLELADRLPADTVAAYFVAKSDAKTADHDSFATLRMASFLADQARRFGLLNQLDDGARLWVDVFTSVSNLIEFPHALALLDIETTAGAGGRQEVVGLQAVLILQTKGDTAKVEERIQHVLSTYTNTEQTTLSVESIDGSQVFSLRDERLPEWSSFHWGRLGDYYVLTVGDAAFARVADASRGASESRLSADTWFGHAFSQTNGGAAVFALYVAPEQLRRAADASFQGRIRAAAKTLGLKGNERALWTAGQRGRAVEAVGVVRRGDRNEFHRIAGASGNEQLVAAVVPDEATSYAIINGRPVAVFRAAAAAYLAARSDSSRRRLEAFWGEVAATTGVSIERDVLAELSGPVIVHNHPRHALRLPLAWTHLFRISGDARLVRERLDALLSEAARNLPEDGSFHLRHDDDGVWYTEFGLTGPGLLVTDRWVIVSFSPQAVRANRDFLASRVAQASDAAARSSTPTP